MSFNEVFSYTAFVHAISGATGGSIAMTTFYPLDVIRTHQQIKPGTSILKIISEEGIDALYRGLRATLISLYASNFVFFYANNLFKVLVKRATKQEITVLQNLAIASLAGVVNVLMTCPLWVANTRLKIQSNKDKSAHIYKGLVHCIGKIAQDEGISTLWSGVVASLILVSNPTINHVMYDKVKSIFMKRAELLGRKNLSPLEIFVAGAIAKALATILTYPIQLAQSRQRSGHGHGRGAPPKKDPSKAGSNDGGSTNAARTAPQYKNMFDVLYQVYTKDGPAGLFAGIEAKLLQTVLMAAFHFLCYEQIKNFIFQILRPAENK
eukprot:TRINITY_DN10365_c0_g1_i1.p1 TRINITY_DN10365_c0_g1~~TRINITY_DN10365_c0_g1_i1.p1  ORF type:complete len:323 (+),score=36.96 TRINITY_DN10365_c0_g1_i1:49-1017(+)